MWRDAHRVYLVNQMCFHLIWIYEFNDQNSDDYVHYHGTSRKNIDNCKKIKRQLKKKDFARTSIGWNYTKATPGVMLYLLHQHETLWSGWYRWLGNFLWWGVKFYYILYNLIINYISWGSFIFGDYFMSNKLF